MSARERTWYGTVTDREQNSREAICDVSSIPPDTIMMIHNTVSGQLISFVSMLVYCS